MDVASTCRAEGGRGLLVPKLQLSPLYTSPAKPKMPSFRHGCRNPEPKDGNLPLAQVLDSGKLPAPRFTSL